MSAGEFELIAQHLTGLGAAREDVTLGVGDDAAIVELAAHSDLRCASVCLALSMRDEQSLSQRIDTAFQSLIVQLRDDGFAPAWATLALTLARADNTLVRAIAAAVHNTCVANDIAIIGGDTTAGACSLTIFLTGVRR